MRGALACIAIMLHQSNLEGFENLLKVQDIIKVYISTFIFVIWVSWIFIFVR